jgi:aryl-alcohol dehydrogenase-like predicted oxidoreductase
VASCRIRQGDRGPVRPDLGRPGQRVHATRLGERVGRADHHLARHASEVGALAADQARLDPHHRQARLGQLSGHLLPADAQPDHDHIDLVRHDRQLHPSRQPTPNRRTYREDMTGLPSRRLGAQLTVPAVGLGCMGMSDFYGPSNEADSLAVLDRAADLGATVWDTSDMYGKGANEALLSRWFATRGRRAEITLATKFGIVRGTRGARQICGDPAYVREACDYSLARLGVDTIDLYYQHRVDPSVPIEDTVGAMAELVRAGKVRYLGLSEAGAETIRRAHAVHPIAALQSEWSLWSRDIESGPVPAARELGIGIVPYSPLGRGFLTGALELGSLSRGDFRGHLPRLAGENLDANQRIVAAVADLARRYSVHTGQIALAWVLARGDDVVPIPGTRRVSYLEQNVAAAAITLSETDLTELDALADLVAGQRYPDMSGIGA